MAADGAGGGGVIFMNQSEIQKNPADVPASRRTVPHRQHLINYPG